MSVNTITPPTQRTRIINDAVTLRPLRLSDAQTVFNLVEANRSHLDEFLPWVATTTTADDSAAFIRDCLEQWDTGKGAHWGVYVQDRLVGHLSLMNIKPEHKAEIGYWLTKQAVGQGIMTKAVQSVVDYAFNDLNLVRVFIRCRSTNTRSAAIAKRLGFSFEGTEPRGEKHQGQFHGYDTYGLLRPSAHVSRIM